MTLPTLAKSDQTGKPKQDQPEFSGRSTDNSAQATTKTVAPAEPREQEGTISQPSERSKKAAEDLAEVNGIVIPSRVPPGQSPNQGSWVEKDFLIHPCSICARKFARKEQVKSHMPACVRRNGNPQGVRWDDAWMRDDQDATANSQSTENNPADPLLSKIGPYNAALPLDIITNEALFDMVKTWQEAARRMGENDAVVHPHYQAVAQELVARGIISRAGDWLVDPEQVEKNFVRV